jgi:hypothetical protein
MLVVKLVMNPADFDLMNRFNVEIGNENSVDLLMV